MLKVLILAQLLLAVVSLARVELPAEWHVWKSRHGKSYESDNEELRRNVVWQSNQKYIDEHNKHSDVFGFTLGMNEYGDLVSQHKFMVGRNKSFFL